MAMGTQFLRSMPQPEFPAEVSLHIKEGQVAHRFMLFGDAPLTDAQVECFRGLTGFLKVNLSETRITDATFGHEEGVVPLIQSHFVDRLHCLRLRYCCFPRVLGYYRRQ